MTTRKEMITTGWKVIYKNSWFAVWHIPVLWWNKDGLISFGGIFDLTMFDMGTKEKHSRYIQFTVLGLRISLRIKKGK